MSLPLKLVLIAPDVDTYTLFDGPNGSSNGADNGNVDLVTEFPTAHGNHQ